MRQDDGREKMGRSQNAPYPSEKKKMKDPVTAPVANSN